MKLYLCSRYSRRDELRAIRERLHNETKHTVIARWLDTEWEEKEVGGHSVAPLEYRRKWALQDVEDVKCCDCLIAFSEDNLSLAGKRGGRHVEFGIALALGKRLIVVGPRENLFHEHPEVEVVACVTSLLRLLKE